MVPGDDDRGREVRFGLLEARAAPIAGETDLGSLLRELRPRINPGEWVFARAFGPAPEGIEPLVTVREDEGTTLVLRRDQADELGLDYGFVAAWITLQVHSSLEAVGLTAVVSQALTKDGISCNVVAGLAHDHLFVPLDRAEEALQSLTALSEDARET